MRQTGILWLGATASLALVISCALAPTAQGRNPQGKNPPDNAACKVYFTRKNFSRLSIFLFSSSLLMVAIIVGSSAEILRLFGCAS